MKKSLTRKLTIAVIALVFAVVSLSTSTYAWFTMSDKAQIDAFEAQVKAGEGIEIAVTSTDAVGNAQWYTGNVPANVVEAAFEANGFTKFQDLTTSDNGKTFTTIDKTTGENKSFDGTDGYVSFYVHIKTAVAGTITLDGIELSSKSENGTNENPIEDWTCDAKYLIASNEYVEVGNTVKYKVENASRIAIIYGDESKVYEKAQESFTKVGVQDGEGNTNYSFVAGNTKGTKSTYGAFDYYNSKNNSDLVISNSKDYTGTDILSTGLTTNSFTTTNTNNEPEVITFQVKIWIEGWDSECINAIFAQTLSTTLKFKFATA